MANTPAVVVEHEQFTRQLSERLGPKITELCSYIYAAEHRLLTLIREFDEQHGWEWLGFPTCAHWLNFKCGIDLNTARERVRVAHALGKLAKVDARLERLERGAGCRSGRASEQQATHDSSEANSPTLRRSRGVPCPRGSPSGRRSPRRATAGLRRRP